MKRRDKAMPEISTTALPDIIFMLLFFFMVVTVLRRNTSVIEYKIPQVVEANKIKESKDKALFYIGKDSENGEVVYQLNNRLIQRNNLETEFLNLVNRPDID